jgi:replication-associated recombination protein RarA
MPTRLNARRSRAIGYGAIWRRFLVIAFEDVGVASTEALIATAIACTDPACRKGVGGDERASGHVARLLADAPKDRSPDHLIRAAHSHPAFEDARRPPSHLPRPIKASPTPAPLGV